MTKRWPVFFLLVCLCLIGRPALAVPTYVYRLVGPGGTDMLTVAPGGTVSATLVLRENLEAGDMSLFIGPAAPPPGTGLATWGASLIMDAAGSTIANFTYLPPWTTLPPGPLTPPAFVPAAPPPPGAMATGLTVGAAALPAPPFPVAGFPTMGPLDPPSAIIPVQAGPIVASNDIPLGTITFTGGPDGTTTTLTASSLGGVHLAFLAGMPMPFDGSVPEGHFVGSITSSAAAIPEPTSFALLTVASFGAGLGCWRRKRQARQKKSAAS